MFSFILLYVVNNTLAVTQVPSAIHIFAITIKELWMTHSIPPHNGFITINGALMKPHNVKGTHMDVYICADI